MKILIVGNIVDGVYLIGPFDDAEQAIEFANHEASIEEWLGATVMSPEEYLAI